MHRGEFDEMTKEWKSFEVFRFFLSTNNPIFLCCEATNSVTKPTDVLDMFLFRKKWCKFKIK